MCTYISNKGFMRHLEGTETLVMQEENHPTEKLAPSQTAIIQFFPAQKEKVYFSVYLYNFNIKAIQQQPDIAFQAEQQHSKLQGYRKVKNGYAAGFSCPGS